MTARRVVPGGKVKRQLFDAQVNLALSIHDTRRKRLATTGFLHSRGEEDSGPLQGSRSQAEPTQSSESTPARDQLFSGSRPSLRSTDQLDEEEVRGLLDVVVAETECSGILERLKEKKQTKHTLAVEQLHKDLAALSEVYESLLRQTGEDVICKLSEYDEKMERLMEGVDDNEVLKSFNFHGIYALWDSVSHESANRKKCIIQMDETFAKHESERTEKISALLRKYTKTLETISYISLSDIHRLINQEAMMLNQALLSNRRALAKLFLNQTEKNLQKLFFYRMRWEDKLQNWKRIKGTEIIGRFQDFINSPEIQSPKYIKATFDAMRSAQDCYSKQRIKILKEFSTTTPPGCSRNKVSDWYARLTAVNEQIDHMHFETLSKLQKYYEGTWQDCMTKMENFKEELINYEFSKEQIQDTVDAEMLPLLGNCQKQVEKQLEALEKAFESLSRNTAGLSEVLFKFIQGACHLWLTHSARLQYEQQQMQTQLEEVQRCHELEKQKKEAQLDIMLDKLRQESSEEALKPFLQKILTFLEEIKKGYVITYKEKIVTVESFPAVVVEELHSYNTALSQFFGVKEVYALDSDQLCGLFPFLDMDATGRVIAEGMEEWTAGLQNTTSPYLTQPSTDNSQMHNAEFDCPQGFLDTQITEAFTTAKGNTYNAQSFVVQCDSEYETGLPEVELVKFTKWHLTETQKDLRLAFFNHMEEEYSSVLHNTVKTVATNKESLMAEQDLCLLLHQSRDTRIEMDIHNLRADELVLHRNRVDRHCKGIVQALSNFHSDFEDLQIQQNQLTEDFRLDVYSMEQAFNSATKSDVLVKLRRTLQSNLEKHMNEIQTSQRQFRHKLDQRLDELRESNAQLMRSFKLFSEGGNFSPKEIEVYQKHLETIAKQIESTEEAIMVKMQRIDSKILEQAKDVVTKSEEKVNILTQDLKFLDTIQAVMIHTQVQIKTESAKSNGHKKRIDDLLAELEGLIKTSSGPCPEMKALEPENIFTIMSAIMEELKKRCLYLECFLDPTMAVQISDAPLQGPFALAARPKSRKQEERSTTTEEDSQNQTSHLRVSFTDDEVADMVKELLSISRPICTKTILTDSATRGAVNEEFPSPEPSRQNTGKGMIESRLERTGRRSVESSSAQSVRRFSKPTRFDKKFQVFGPKPEEQSPTTFKGLISSILWKSNDVLLLIAEEFYKKKERRAVSRPQHLQETFSQCAEEINKRLLNYQRQTENYHNNCLQEFRKQLRNSEDLISKVPVMLISQLVQELQHRLNKDVDVLRQRLDFTLEESDKRKKKHSKLLTVRLSHPACEKELHELQEAEAQRQMEESSAICSNTLELQACVKQHGDDFVTSLVLLTERLLFQMDNLLTIDEVQVGQSEEKREDITSLLHEKQSDSQKRNSIKREHGLELPSLWPANVHQWNNHVGRQHPSPQLK
ncbi:coiled-coil domain-containing protein 180-like isoform X2 [Denticeps clupeoides]|uniref:coiled-coil domain-containing protein 180-like isoform X2 n=1 Tax=Denticeps clupeoides TaxID=299321 RepID=UPI0010A53E39|nr:coiled-coil domain-containing protein 180-like isoform X2 [Denticeps clupeoides]